MANRKLNGANNPHRKLELTSLANKETEGLRSELERETMQLTNQGEPTGPFKKKKQSAPALNGNPKHLPHALCTNMV